MSESPKYQAYKDDLGLVLTEPASHYAISASLSNVITPDGTRPFILQYEVKLLEGLECGGAYIKVLTEMGKDGKYWPDKLNNESIYSIMFGPDKCGADDKVIGSVLISLFRNCCRFILFFSI